MKNQMGGERELFERGGRSTIEELIYGFVWFDKTMCEFRTTRCDW